MYKFTFKGKMPANKLLLLSAFLFVLTGNAFAQERSWKTFSPPGGEWSILAPGDMMPDQAALESPSEMGTYSYNDAKSFFAVIYRDTPEGRVLWKPFKKSYFKKVRKEFVKSNKGQLLRDEEFSNAIMKGREVYVKVPDGSVLTLESQVKTKHRIQRMRMFFHGRRFYLLLTVLPEEEINKPEIDNYLNSFVLK